MPLVLEDPVTSFVFNSSLVPGQFFECHIELVLPSADLGLPTSLPYLELVMHLMKVTSKT